MMRHVLLGRFRPVKSYRDNGEDCFSCCAFSVRHFYTFSLFYTGCSVCFLCRV